MLGHSFRDWLDEWVKPRLSAFSASLCHEPAGTPPANNSPTTFRSFHHPPSASICDGGLPSATSGPVRCSLLLLAVSRSRCERRPQLPGLDPALLPRCITAHNTIEHSWSSHRHIGPLWALVAADEELKCESRRSVPTVLCGQPEACGQYLKLRFYRFHLNPTILKLHLVFQHGSVCIMGQ